MAGKGGGLAGSNWDAGLVDLVAPQRGNTFVCARRGKVFGRSCSGSGMRTGTPESCFCWSVDEEDDDDALTMALSFELYWFLSSSSNKHAAG